ncbi:MAG: DHHA1 domain-containing protein, partial [Acidimicrobiia bacterium]|nr:DHHA1 domain-containing protein [Acidimicrobiia bacterium]
ELRNLATSIRDRLGRGSVTVLGSRVEGKGSLIAAVSPDLVDAGVSAAELITPAARELGGGGSRDPELAQAGGPDGSKLEKALDLARDAATKALSNL